MIIMGCLTFVGCGEVTYTAAAEFFYSADKGETYGNRTKEYAVGETVYMQVIVKVQSTSKTAEDIHVALTIPNITAVDSKYYDLYEYGENSNDYTRSKLGDGTGEVSGIWTVAFPYGTGCEPVHFYRGERGILFSHHYNGHPGAIAQANIASRSVLIVL